MTMTGLRVFDETIHTTHTWLHELESRLGLAERQQAYRVLRAGLHSLRDALSVQEAAHLSAQLPMLVRGVYFEGWRPSAVPVRPADRAAFLSGVGEVVPPGIDAEAAMREVIAVMALHVSRGEMEDVRRCLPESLRDLWEPG